MKKHQAIHPRIFVMNPHRKRIFWDISEGNITKYRRQQNTFQDEINHQDKIL
ncbi:hypothetical protein J2Z26_002488 [Bacillus luteolus]|nr:hypothetical protein [Cytobacillus luteolus]